MFSEQAVSTAILYELTSDRGPLYFKLDEADYKRMTSVFELITDSDTSGTLNKRYIRNLCECAMITILQKRNLIPDTKKLSKSIYRTILYINRNFRSDISIDMLACEANLSKNYFCSQFKSIFGTSTVEYINSVRLEYAKNMLVSTDIPITEICFNSGFGSYPVFSRAFKNYYGCTPSRMREGNGFSNADV